MPASGRGARSAAGRAGRARFPGVPWTKLPGASMVPVRLASLLLLTLGLPAWGQSSQEPSARNPPPDESWAAPAEVPAPRRTEAPAAEPRTAPAEVPAPRRNESADDTSWDAFPGATSVPQGQDAAALPKLPEVPPLVPVDDGRMPVRASAPRPPAPPPGPPPVPNRVSLLGARTVGRGGVAAGLSLGFPTLSARVALGVLPRVDAVVGLDSLYGMMNEVRLGGRWLALDGGPRWSLGLALEGGYAFFLRPASVEDKGARYLSGRRNWNVLPGIVGNYQMRGARAPRLFLDLRYHLSLDTESIQRTPLGGLPPRVVAGSAFPLRVGAEVPLSEKTSYSLTVGADVRTRPEDPAFMPVLSVGIVTGL